MVRHSYYELSTWRRLVLRGEDRKDFLQGLVTNDVLRAGLRQELPCCLLTPKGKLQAHFWHYDLAESSLLIVPEACAANLKAALEKVILLSQSRLSDESDRTRLYFVGQAPETLSAGLCLPFSALGKPGALCLIEPSQAAGFEQGLERGALTAREFEARRISSGLPLFGIDMDGETIPLEARLESAISYTKGCYMGQETISRIHHMGHVNRLLVGLRFEGAAAPAPAPVTAEGVEVGRLTSSQGELGLALVRVEHAREGTRLSAGQRPASVVDLWRSNASGV